MSLHRRHLGAFLLVLLAAGSNATLRGSSEKKESAEKQDKDEGKKKKEEGLPLKPARKVEFTTDEGTWLSLDISPDGKTIVFELLGHLYTLPMEGGEAKQLTSGMPFDSQPRYCPDGNMITFISDRDGAENVCVGIRLHELAASRSGFARRTDPDSEEG